MDAMRCARMATENSCKINDHCKHQASDLYWPFVVVVVVVAIVGVFFPSSLQCFFFVGFWTFGRMMWYTHWDHTQSYTQEVDEKNAQNRTFLLFSLSRCSSLVGYFFSTLFSCLLFSTIFIHIVLCVVKEAKRCLCISCWIIPVLQF